MRARTGLALLLLAVAGGAMAAELTKAEQLVVAAYNARVRREPVRNATPALDTARVGDAAVRSRKDKKNKKKRRKKKNRRRRRRRGRKTTTTTTLNRRRRNRRRKGYD